MKNALIITFFAELFFLYGFVCISMAESGKAENINPIVFIMFML